MNSVNLELALLALVFVSLGFLLHAFYFGDSRYRRSSKEKDDLKKELQLKAEELRQAEEECQKADRTIQSLEKQLQLRASEMDHLKQLASKQDKAIATLQKDAEVIRAAVSGSAKSIKSVQKVLSVVEPVNSAPVEAPPVPAVPVQAHEQPRTQETTAAPPWKENLDNILSLLDSMEKEVDK